MIGGARAACLGLVLAAAGCAPPPTLPGGPAHMPLDAGFSPATGVRHALGAVCLPHLMQGRSIEGLLGPYGRRQDDAYMLVGAGAVRITTERPGFCTVRTAYGNHEALRAAALETVRAAAPSMRPFQDSGPSPTGRQEGWCGALPEGGSLSLVLTTAPKARPRRWILQGTLIRQSEGCPSATA